jgi:hypothetical protein
MLVYLCSGECRQVSKAVAATIVGDCLMCLGKQGRVVAQFPASDVYLVSKSAIPTIPA